MKRVLLVGACIYLLAAVVSAFAEPVKLAERTAVKVALLETLTSGKGKPNDEVRFELREDLFGPGREVLAAKGALAFGHIIRSKKRGIFGRAGKLDFSCDYVTAVDGTKVALRGSEAKSGKDNGAATIATMVLLAPIAFLVNGKDVTADKNSEYTAYVDKDTLIDAEKTATDLVVLKNDRSTPAGSTYTISLKPSVFIEIAKQLASSTKLATDATVAVTWFELIPEKTGTQIDRIVSRNACDDLSNALSNKVKIIDRILIAEYVTAQQLDISKSLEISAAKALGDTVKASHVVTGSISDRGAFAIVTAQIIESKTGILMGTASTEVQK